MYDQEVSVLSYSICPSSSPENTEACCDLVTLEFSGDGVGFKSVFIELNWLEMLLCSM